MLLVSFSVSAQQRQISYVETSGSWYHVYDTNGKKITTLASSSVGEVIHTWEKTGKKLATRPAQ